MSLYLKHRPTSLDQIRGNPDVTSTLESMLNDLKTCPHVFMLHGPTGCGKTTVGRIIAARVGCKGDDFREVNTADFRGIETARDIIQNSQFSPMEGICRVWLIDECHRLTGDAQNAFLKILEDTPKHVYFILCTTEPQKLIPTIRNRCIQLQLKPLTEIQLQGLLRTIVHEEGMKMDMAVIEQIARDSLGLPRTAIQILEQVLKVEPERQLEYARQTAAIQAESIELCRSLISGDGWKKISNILNGLKDHEAEEVRRHVMAYCQSVLLSKENDRAGLILEVLCEPQYYNVGWPGLIYCFYSITKNQ